MQSCRQMHSVQSNGKGLRMKAETCQTKKKQFCRDYGTPPKKTKKPKKTNSAETMAERGLHGCYRIVFSFVFVVFFCFFRFGVYGCYRIVLFLVYLFHSAETMAEGGLHGCYRITQQTLCILFTPMSGDVQSAPSIAILSLQ